MTDKTQPEALRLADDLEASSHFPGNMRSCNNAAAAELRRQHARIAELEAELEAVGAGGVQALSAGPAEAPTADVQAKIASNTWDHFGDILPTLKAISRGDWYWGANTRCKYIEIRIDTRDGGCILYDRERVRISPEQFAHQSHPVGKMEPWPAANQVAASPTPPAEQQAAPDGEPSNVELRGLWYGAGGSFHGPSVETGTMPEAKLLPFLRSLLRIQAAPKAAPGERCQHCINRTDGFYGSYAPPCPHHDDDGKPRAQAAPQQEAQYNHGPQAETVEEAARDVGKWLNERPNRPLDLRHVAMLAHYATAPQQEAQEPVVAAVFDEQLGRPVIVEGAPLLSPGQPLYTAPQPAPAPLTDAAARALVWSSSDWIRSNSVNEDDAVELVRGAERVHGITQKGGA